jgi:hypothetical protein
MSLGCAFKESKPKNFSSQNLSLTVQEPIGELQVLLNDTKVIAKSKLTLHENSLTAIDPLIYEVDEIDKKNLKLNIIFNNPYFNQDDLNENYNAIETLINHEIPSQLSLNQVSFSFSPTELEQEKREFLLKTKNKSLFLLKFTERKPAKPLEISFLNTTPNYDSRTGLTKIGVLKITKNDIRTRLEFPNILKANVKTTVSEIRYENVKVGECLVGRGERCSFKQTNNISNFEEIKNIYLTKNTENLNFIQKTFQLNVEKEEFFEVYIKQERLNAIQINKVCHTFKPKQVYDGFCKFIHPRDMSYWECYSHNCSPYNPNEAMHCRFLTSGPDQHNNICGVMYNGRDYGLNLSQPYCPDEYIQKRTVNDYNVLLGFVIDFNEELLSQFQHRFVDLSPNNDRTEKVVLSAPLILYQGNPSAPISKNSIQVISSLKYKLGSLKSAPHDPNEARKLQDEINQIEFAANCRL